MAMGNQEAPTIQDYHNQNCFEYLKSIKATPKALLDALFGKRKTLDDLFNQDIFLSGLFDQQQFDELRNILTNPNYKYKPDISYANLYSRFLTILEDKLSTKNPNLESHFNPQQDYKTWFNQIYANKNNVLSQTFELFKDKLSERSLVGPRPEQVVATALNVFVATDTAHLFTPQEMGSALGRFSALISSNFKPMLTTSIPSVRDYTYTTKEGANYPQELRFGTQAQRHEDEVRVSPLFKEWLRIHQTDIKDKIEHVYFNLLGADRTDYEGKKEKEMTDALANLEKEHSNLAIITLPADKGLMQSNAFEESKKNILADDAFKQMKEIVMGKSDLAIKDFYVSDRIKQKLYNGNEDEIVDKLLRHTFFIMGINLGENQVISKAQQQSLWFDFCKYQFPDFVLNTLKPNTWNASCKDAIDRGGVASSYLNMMRSFTSENPMSREEFEQSLHAAAAVVKGRGLNHHYEIIWNAINHYVDANFEQLANTPAQRWLIHWRNDNTPYAIAQSHEYLKKVIEQNQKLIDKIVPQDDPLVAKSREIIDTVKPELFEDYDKGLAKLTSGKRLLLEVVSKTTQLALEPAVKNTRDQLNHALETLNEQSIFKPICRLLTTFIDFLAKHFSSVREMRGNFYSTLVRHGDDRSAVKKLKEDTQQLIQEDPQANRPKDP
jgi:hypothetical protein